MSQLQMMTIEIYSRMNDGPWVFAGAGQLRGNRIVGCPADIGDSVYGALEGAIEYDTTTLEAVPGKYRKEVDGTEWVISVRPGDNFNE